jgi:predicted HTH domain antitoxin
MGTVSARVPDELEEELEEFINTENLDRSTAIRKLLAEGLADWRQDHALELFEDGEVTVSRGAEIAGLSTWEFVTLAQDRGVTWVGDDGLADDLESF